MDLKRLAAKQKRYNDWLRFTNEELQDLTLKPTIMGRLSDYKKALAACWSKGAATPDDESLISSLERDLEQLNNEARLRVPGRAGSL
jgi:hypothetical protein